MNKLIKFLIIAGLVLSVPGCGSSLFNQHVKDQEVLRSLALEAGKQLEGTGQVAGGAQGINPGIRVSAGMEYYAIAKYDGLAGQMTFAKQGTLTKEISPEDAALIRQIANDTSLSQADKREKIFQIVTGVLGQNESPEN